jgi:uncharacterized protein
VASSESSPQSSGLWAGFLKKRPWLVFVLPILVYLLVGSFLEPTHEDPAGKTFGMDFLTAYPLIYAVKIALTLAAMAMVFPGYRQFRRPPGLLAVLVGAVGIFVWIGLWYLPRQLGLNDLLADLLHSGHRPAYDPWELIAVSPAWGWTFLAVRFFGLVIVVPVIEEFFLRGFLLRVVVDQDWPNVPFGTAPPVVVAVSIVLPMLYHPTELLAAAAWFGMITWLMIRTRNIWDCVAAHAVTNLLLGLYIVTMHQWELW